MPTVRNSFRSREPLLRRLLAGPLCPCKQCATGGILRHSGLDEGKGGEPASSPMSGRIGRVRLSLNSTVVYPSPGYLRLCFRAHRKAGQEVSENFLDTTLLMDRKTTLRTYLDANPALSEYVFDPNVHADWVSDRYE